MRLGDPEGALSAWPAPFILITMGASPPTRPTRGVVGGGPENRGAAGQCALGEGQRAWVPCPNFPEPPLVSKKRRQRPPERAFLGDGELPARCWRFEARHQAWAKV